MARLLRRWQGARGRLGLVREVIRVGQRHCRLVMAAVLAAILQLFLMPFSNKQELITTSNALVELGENQKHQHR